jgi:hypothetical protein
MAGLRRLTYRQLEIAGWILYAVSWITPSRDARQLGAQAFVNAVDKGTSLVLHAGRPAGVVVGACLLLGWLANFSILVRWSPRTRLAWIVAPWFPFVALLFARPAPSPVPLLYFYPWAIGIGLIHVARLAQRP